jgi:bifunctional non-homologous end joining protein LigD
MEFYTVARPSGVLSLRASGILAALGGAEPNPDPEGTRPFLGALLLAYYDPEGRLIYAGRAGTGIGHRELERLWRRLQPLATPRMPLDKPPPRDSRFGSPLTLSRVHWVRPELVAEVKYLTWTEDNLLRQVVYEGLSEDKPPKDVRRPILHPQPE